MRSVSSCSIPLAALTLERSNRSTPSSENVLNRGRDLLYSTELRELTGLCDRCIVVYGNRIVGECHSKSLTEERLIEMMHDAEAQVSEGEIDSGPKQRANAI